MGDHAAGEIIDVLARTYVVEEAAGENVRVDEAQPGVVVRLPLHLHLGLRGYEPSVAGAVGPHRLTRNAVQRVFAYAERPAFSPGRSRTPFSVCEDSPCSRFPASPAPVAFLQPRVACGATGGDAVAAAKGEAYGRNRDDRIPPGGDPGG